MSSKTTWELDLKTLINEVFQEPDLSKRWYLVIDNESRRCSAFFRHRHVSYVDCLEKNSMDPEKLRLIILNSLRHGGTIIFGIHFMAFLSEIYLVNLPKRLF